MRIESMSVPRFNVVSAPGWDDDGPLGPARCMGQTDDPAELPGLLAEAEAWLARNNVPLPESRLWVADASGCRMPLHAVVAALASGCRMPLHAVVAALMDDLAAPAAE